MKYLRVVKTEISRAEFDSACRFYTTRPSSGTSNTGGSTGGSTGTGNPKDIGIKDMDDGLIFEKCRKILDSSDSYTYRIDGLILMPIYTKVKGDKSLKDVTNNTAVNEKKRKRYLFYGLFNPNTLAIEGGLYKMAEAKYRGQGYTYPTFTLSSSKDKQFLVVLGNHAHKRKKGEDESSEKFITETDGNITTKKLKKTFWVFDNNMSTVNYQKTLRLEAEDADDKISLHDVEVDTDGNVYVIWRSILLERVSAQDSREKKKKTKYNKSSFIIVRISPDGEETQYNTHKDLLLMDH